ncbi:MAG TPA: serine protease, partial [Elusimicrobiota bacterium]|nr:serine protease [Elusimicrobiota bacterium]
MFENKIKCFDVLVFILSTGIAFTQCYGEPNIGAIPIATKWEHEAASPTQINPIESVYLMYCPASQMKGTAFLLSDGMIVTNNHVVKECTKDNIVAFSSSAKRITFEKMITDPVRDLAVLRPSQHLDGGLNLGSEDPLRLGEAVYTFGYPYIDDGPAPLLS